MEPSDLAGMLAREVEAGIVAALASVEAAGILDVDTIVARVGSHPESEAVDWSRVTWQSEYVLRVRRDAARGVAQDDGTMTLPRIVAALPVRALVGVGKHWERVLTAAGMDTVGKLAAMDSGAVHRWIARGDGHVATLAGRARALPTRWPETVPPSLARYSVLHMLENPPDPGAGVRGEVLAAWEYCLALAAGIDREVLAQLPLGGL